MTLADRLAKALVPAREALVSGDGAEDLMPPDPIWREAAVLVAVTDRTVPGVLLTRRAETLRNHAGQVAFPGGRADPGDADLVATALREAWEEIALPPEIVRPVATLDRYHTVTGFAVTPVLAAVPADLKLRPDDREVASIFEVPLPYLLDPANLSVGERQFRGRLRRFYQIDWAGERIWGATAAMIVNLGRRLAWH